jgi:2-polyprenyl-6-methoxyphenol hydroxylase-like FAD-dependent oxidoreductase
VQAFGCPLGSMDLLRSDGGPLSRLPLERLRAEVGPVYACHRAELHAALAAALPKAARTALGYQVSALSETADGTTLTLTGAGGEAQQVRARLVIGADGLRSSVRTLLGEGAPLRYSGETCWRAIVRGVAAEGASESWGVRARVGVVPLRPGEDGAPRVYTFWTAYASPGAPPLPFREVVARFSAFEGLARRVVDATREQHLVHHDLWETAAPSWGRGRVWLLGDAAHGMTPNQGQGAAMAIEDALALALALPGPIDLSAAGLTAAHARYVSARHQRVRQVQLDSRRLGQVAGLAARPLRWLRDLALRLAPESASLAHYRKLAAPGLALAAEFAAAHG